MGLLLLSFIAGVLTIVAPCVLPILPVILGGSVINGEKSRPRVIILSFAISILIFTLLIQFFVSQFGLSLDQLTKASAWILIVMGLLFLFPKARQTFTEITGIEKATNSVGASQHSGVWGDILMGAALGPIFNTCSPTYIVLISTILPASFAWGLVNILVYIVGLCLMLSLIIRGGRALLKKLKWFANPNGIFKKVIAVLLIVIGVGIMFKRDKQLESYLIENGLTIDTTEWEYQQVKEYK